MWSRRSLWTPLIRKNVWWVRAERSALWIFSEKYFEDSFTEEGMESGNYIFEGGFKFVASESSKKFNSTALSGQREEDRSASTSTQENQKL